MATTPPDWLPALAPCTEPFLAPIRPGSDVVVWHIPVELRAWTVPAHCILAGRDTWNGKPLVISANPAVERSVGEVEIAERLRRNVPSGRAYWTAGGGNPPAQWKPWALRQALAHYWFDKLDAAIRRDVPLLTGNNRGVPDVIWWHAGPEDVCFVEYKGPRRTTPTQLDEISDFQEAWARSALKRGLLDRARYAVATWRPARHDAEQLTARFRASQHAAP